ncbi:hypothetical protein [Nocardia niigatensis]
MFSDDAALDAMQREVFAQNARAQSNHEHSPGRPLISLVYFAGISYTGNSNYPGGVLEELAGLLAQQRTFDNRQEPTEPLVRIIIANGGDGMKQASWGGGPYARSERGKRLPCRHPQRPGGLVQRAVTTPRRLRSRWSAPAR